ncbi:S1-C subfamily serine protease [Paenibacillus sp. DS2015]|uniref:S1 family peptidase n=1 Tax=Paenibacillus sp. DS2015 TaxID=3373917 RepID=UPI003D233408
MERKKKASEWMKKWVVGMTIVVMLTTGVGVTANAQSLDSMYFVGGFTKIIQEKLARTSDSIFVVNVTLSDEDDPESAYYSIGTSILISEDELITNYHVIQDYAEMKATDEATLRVASPANLSEWIEADVVFTDKKRDTAILKLHQKVKYQPITFEQARDNQSVITIGYPANPTGQLILLDQLDDTQILWNTVTKTRIYKSHERLFGKNYIGSVPIELAHGNSGGPVLDQNMNVVGMMTFVYDGRTYFLTADTLEIFIERYRQANK